MLEEMIGPVLSTVAILKWLWNYCASFYNGSELKFDR